LAIEWKTFGSILLPISCTCVPAVHLILALKVALTLLIGALLTRAESPERPVDGHAAVEARPAVRVLVAVLVLVEAKALALLALLGDALMVGATVAARVQ